MDNSTKMNVIFLVGTHPRDLTIAVRTNEAAYHGAYQLITAANGWSDCDLITDSDQLEEIPLNKLPAELRSDFGFKQKLKYLQTAYIHK